MKWLSTRSLIFAIMMPPQAAQGDNPAPPDFGPLSSLVGEWHGKDQEGKPMTASYQWTGGGTSLVETMKKAQKPMMTIYHAAREALC